MTPYIVLTTATVVFLSLAYCIWVKSRSVAFLVGLAFAYYWSLWGGWFIVYDLSGGSTGMQYDYLYHKLFPIHLDDDYLWTLGLYSIFLLAIECVLLLRIQGRSTETPVHPLRVYHAKLLIIAIVTGLASFLIVRKSFATAGSLGLSAYHFVRNDPVISRFYTLHQMLNRMALFSCLMGVGIYLSGRAPKYIQGYGRRIHLFVYAAVLLGLVLMNVMLGDRHDLVANGMVAMLFYLVNARKPNHAAVTAILAVGVIAVSIIGVTRGAAVGSALSDKGPGELVFAALKNTALSNEPFAAHMSLYGSIHKNLELTNGTSFLALVASVIPRALWLDRPTDIYQYYASQVGAEEGQGYTIHHAAGWYLNFGTAGVIVGAIVFAWLWATLWNGFCQSGRGPTQRSLIFRTIAFWTFTASISVLLRAGPEGYKSVVIGGLIIPLLIITFAGSKMVMRKNRPALQFGGFASVRMQPQVRL